MVAHYAAVKALNDQIAASNAAASATVNAAWDKEVKDAIDAAGKEGDALRIRRRSRRKS